MLKVGDIVKINDVPLMHNGQTFNKEAKGEFGIINSGPFNDGCYEIIIGKQLVYFTEVHLNKVN